MENFLKYGYRGENQAYILNKTFDDCGMRIHHQFFEKKEEHR